MRALALIVLLSLLPTPSAGAPDPSVPAFVPGRIVVRYRTESGVARRLGALAAGSAQGVAAAPAGVDAVSGAPLEWLTPPLRHIETRRGGVAPDAEISRLNRTVRLRLSPGEDPGEAARLMAARPDVEWAAPVRLIPLAEVLAGTPNDPSIEAQWHHAAIGSTRAWDLSTGDSTVVIAVIDTGIDLAQADLVPTLWVNRAESTGLPGVDDDDNGYVDDLHGFDFTDVPEIDGAGDFTGRDPVPLDDVGHGTWVAGAACAAGDNGIDGAGVAYGCRVMALRAGFRPRGGLSLGYLAEDDAAAAIVYAVDNGADILNLSFGDRVRAPILEDAIGFALARGVLVAAAAGNAGSAEPYYPAAISGVLAVGASDRAGLRAGFSNFGNDVALLAPGVAIVTTELGGGVTSKSGTSLASPVAAGAAALLMSVHPDWSAGKISATLLAGSRAPAPGVDLRGARHLDIGAAISAEGRVSIDLPGLEDGHGVDQRLVVRGSVHGGDVRGWRVLVRRGADDPWRTLADSPRATVYDDTLASWDTRDEPEGPATLRVEAIGVDRLAAEHEVALLIDHSPPVVTNATAIPIVSGEGYGFRVTSETDDEALGCVRLGAGEEARVMAEIVGTRFHVLGLNGPYPPGGRLPFEMTMTNWADLAVRSELELIVPELGPPSLLTTHTDGPPLISFLPRVVDLNGDGRPDIVGERLPTGGQSYGQVVAYNPVMPGEPTSPPFELAWESSQTFLPQDAGDFDGDGRADILGLALQEIRVYSQGPAGGFPNRLGWRSTEAWPSHFIPAAAGPGLDIVASRDDELRIYQREGAELVLFQALKNPTGGANSITPFIVSGVFERNGPLALATIDGDGDLLVYRRGPDGRFFLQFSRSLGASAPGVLAAGDLDGDGVDELSIVTTIGTFPSPSDGLRDGFFRLQVFRVTPGGLDIRATLGASGFFPGNPTSLSAQDMDGDGSREIWWTAGRLLYRLVLEEGELRLQRSWAGVTGARPCLWERPAAEGGAALLFPGDLSNEHLVSPGVWFTSSNPSAADPQTLGLGVTNVRDRGDRVDLTLSWRGVGAVSLERAPGGLEGPPGALDPRIVALTSDAFVDTGLVAGETYRYLLRRLGSSDRPADSLVIVARPANPIRSITRTGDYAIVEWTTPIHPLEGAGVIVEDARSGASVLQRPLFPTPDRGGLRLLVGLPPGFDEGPALILRVSGYLSETNLPLRPEDARVVVPPPAASAALVLRSAVALDPLHLRLTFEPGVPSAPTPDAFELSPPIPVRAVRVLSATALELELATPLANGAASLRIRPGLLGPGGSGVRIGEGDAIAFRAGPVIYPNPAHSITAVHFEGLTPGALIEVFDMMGRAVWSATVDASGEALWEAADSVQGRRPPGVYLYRIEGAAAIHGKLAVVG